MAGDMIVGALLSCGAPWGVVEEAVGGMAVPGLTVACQPCQKGAISATQFTVQWRATSPPVHRHLPEILKMVGQAGLSPRAAAWAAGSFNALARAEAHIHGMPVEKVHLHEVGAEDSIADVVAACAALDALGIASASVGPIVTGLGWTWGAHGPLPVPAPATAELLRGFVIEQGGVQEELTTPTAAALMQGFQATPVHGLPQGRLIGVGYGAGTEDFEHPNLLRVMLMETAESRQEG